MLKTKRDFDGKLVQAILPFNDTDACENCFESLDEHWDGGSVTVTEADIFVETVENV